MKTTVFANKDVAQFDSQITDQLPLISGTEKSVREERMQIGIRNENGDIYRAIGITGMGNFLEAINKLVEIGLIDELQFENGMRQGYDAIFRLP